MASVVWLCGLSGIPGYHRLNSEVHVLHLVWRIPSGILRHYVFFLLLPSLLIFCHLSCRTPELNVAGLQLLKCRASAFSEVIIYQKFRSYDDLELSHNISHCVLRYILIIPLYHHFFIWRHAMYERIKLSCDNDLAWPWSLLFSEL